jgi:3-dehydrosphinganine reductase
MTFRNQVVLITGGSSGIGLATARAFAREGAHVWLLARNTALLAQALEEVKASSGHREQCCGFVSADVADPEQATRAVAEVVSRAGLPDIVVNSAGVARPGYFQELDLSVFHEMMDTNYFGALHVIRAATPGMIERRSGHIVNVSSGAAVVPTFGYTAYGASKCALRGLSDVLRLELKRYNIRVSVVYPPDTDTPQLAWEAQYKPPETHDVYGGVVVSADFVAKTVLDGVRHNRYSIIPGLETSAAARVTRLLGDWQFILLDQLIGRARRKQERSVRHNEAGESS